MKKAFIIVLFFLLFYSSHFSVYAEGIGYRIEMLPWEEANRLLPKYAKFTVLDVETGKRFRVQRRAGSNHADVQPITARDTAIMKKIYNGKWSWKRRAIIVIHKDQWVAASMHGMPHGAGALQNNFPGHFCIHFYGSTTHRTKTMDISHMLMIFKAAGKLNQYLNQADPYEAINAYMAGLKQHDQQIVSGLSLQKMAWKPIFPKIKNIKISRLPMLPAEDLAGEIILETPVEIDLITKENGQQSYKGMLRLLRFSPNERWRVDSVHFLDDTKILD